MKYQPSRHSISTSSRARGGLAAATLLLALASSSASAEVSREERQRRLDFLVGTWSTSHTVPAGEGKTTTISGQAVIEWAVGESWLRHEFHAADSARGPVFLLTLMNFSPSKNLYNLYFFDHFGGEAGAFYGDWNDSDELVLTARFEQEDGSESYQRLTLAKVSRERSPFRPSLLR